MLLSAKLYTDTIDSPANFATAKYDEFSNTINKTNKIFNNGSKQVLADRAETNQGHFAIIYGLDYEYNFGLHLGLNLSTLPSSVAKNTKDLNQVTSNFQIGYNIAKLLRKQ